MADITSSSAASRSHYPLASFFSSIWNCLIYLGEASARARSLQAIAELTDDQLDALGTTRSALIQRIMAGSDHH